MEIMETPRRLEDCEFQELLRQLAVKGRSGFANPQLTYPSRGATRILHKKRVVRSDTETSASM
jgi:hypothetical protein